MKLIELHILQSFPVSCLNRDDIGSPKSAIFGGAPRARISSQCLKRAIREYAQQNISNAGFHGERTKLLVQPFTDALTEKGIANERAQELASRVVSLLAGMRNGEVQTLMFLSPSEINSIAEQIKAFKDNDEDNGDPSDNDIKRFCKQAPLTDGVDIAIFGRMVASLPDLTLEGAAMFSHALSTHKAENDLDFYAAVDDRQPEEESGAGMIGTLEFNSAVYYRYAALNLDLLFDENHLKVLNTEQRKNVVDAFIRSTLMAVPGARKNSMNAATLPGYVLGTYKEAGTPIQLINAFETPVWSKNGILEASIKKLETHYEELKKTWGIETTTEVKIPDKNIKDFVNKLIEHVR